MEKTATFLQMSSRILIETNHSDAHPPVGQAWLGSGPWTDDLRFRVWGETDVPFLWEMFYQSLYVRDGQDPFPRSIIETPGLARYLTDFGTRDGDDAQICTVPDGQRIGATWVRRMTSEDPGYGFVREGVPEMGIAIQAPWRGRGIGRRLLQELLVRHPVMSLSVDDQHVQASGLYRSLGFVVFASTGGSTTMIRQGADG